jgi:hypothetical protein
LLHSSPVLLEDFAFMAGRATRLRRALRPDGRIADEDGVAAGACLFSIAQRWVRSKSLIVPGRCQRLGNLICSINNGQMRVRASTIGSEDGSTRRYI